MHRADLFSNVIYHYLSHGVLCEDDSLTWALERLSWQKSKFPGTTCHHIRPTHLFELVLNMNHLHRRPRTTPPQCCRCIESCVIMGAEGDDPLSLFCFFSFRGRRSYLWPYASILCPRIVFFCVLDSFLLFGTLAITSVPLFMSFQKMVPPVWLVLNQSFC